MKIRRKHFFLIVLLFSVEYGIAGNIINTNDYPYWRELASNSSFFSAMKSSAISTANNDTKTRDVMGGMPWLISLIRIIKPII